MKRENNDTRIVIGAIKSWMKKHSGQNIPGFADFKVTMNLSVDKFVNFTMAKKQAFRELEQDGYVLKYNDLRTVAMVDSYKTPSDAGQKVASRLCGLEQDLEEAPIHDKTEEASEPEQLMSTPEQPILRSKNVGKSVSQNEIDDESESKKQKPPLLLYINKQNALPKDCESYGNVLAALSNLPIATRLSIQVQVKELRDGK